MKNIYYNSKDEKSERIWFKNVKLIGELDNGTSVYVEDYVYTYIKQYSISDLSKEVVGVLVGEHKKEAKQIIVNGFLPIKNELLDKTDYWINKESLLAIEEDLDSYFPESVIVGWMHTQPGYGIMTTTKEEGVHEKFFGDQEVLMLVDPVSNVDGIYIKDKKSFKKKEGFCIFYEKNKPMQEFMIENPLDEKEKEESTDQLAANFREKGVLRKKKIKRKKTVKIAISIVGIIMLIGISFVSGIYTNENSYIADRTILNDKEIECSNLDTNIKSDLIELTSFEPEVLMKKVEKIEKTVEEDDDEVKKIESDVLKYRIHFVEIGDSLLDLSYKYFQNPEMTDEIARINNISNKDSIYIGQEIKIPIIQE